MVHAVKAQSVSGLCREIKHQNSNEKGLDSGSAQTRNATGSRKGANMLEITPATVVQVIFLAREGAVAETQLHEFIAGLNEDDKAELTAIAWIGRGSFEAEEFSDAVATARAEATIPTEDYLMGMPHLAENLEGGLEALGVDVTGEEEDLL